jgi:hypothetical protein
MTTRHRLHPTFIPVPKLDEATLARLEAVRYASMPSLVGRSREVDFERYRKIVSTFDTCCVFKDENDKTEGGLVISRKQREAGGRRFVWEQIEQLYLDPEFRGLHVFIDAWVRFTLRARLRYPSRPVVFCVPVFPGSWLDLSDRLSAAVLWGEERTSPWQESVIEALLPEVAGSHEVLRESKVLQLAVTSGSKAPPHFHHAGHRRAFERYEARAPEWREGRVPILMAPVHWRDLGRALVTDFSYKARGRLGR